MEFHDVANIFPLLTGDEYESLRDDIAINGLIEDIWTYENKIIDGRNRYIACLELGIEPRFREWNGRGSLVLFVVSLNGKRRNLTSSQKAMVALDIEKQLAIEAKARMMSGKPLDPVEIIQQGKASEQAALVVGTNMHYVIDAKRIQQKAPDLADRVRSGELTIPKAKAIINRRERDEFMQESIDIRVPEGKYRTIVIDPPWEMEKVLREVRPNQTGFEYPTMSIDRIKAFSIPADIADDDCHLFMWTTQKYLPAALDILNTWGFRYVFTMVWHKSGGYQPYNLPQYNCEFVLYGRIGSPEFLDTKAFSTCFDGERREHSRKPDKFYELIKRVTPGPRIDIFSREMRDGFNQYGNEMDKFNYEQLERR